MLLGLTADLQNFHLLFLLLMQILLTSFIWQEHNYCVESLAVKSIAG